MCLNPCFSGTYSQRGRQSTCSAITQLVLILVLVEHTLRVRYSDVREELSPVLILVLVEHTLRD